MPTATLQIDTAVAERRRALAGLTQRELAERARVSHKHLNRVLTGHTRPSAPLVRRLADALGCETVDLVRDDPAVA